jgi:hypothetical protein
MTFAEYNTDDNFKGKSTADELVKIGFDEGKTREEIETSLSPLWKEDKKGNVKKALDKYYKTETPKAEEEKPTEEKVLEKVVTETAPQTETKLDKQTQDYMNKNDAIADTQEDNEYERQRKELFSRWDARNKNIDEMSQSMRRIDDHMVDQLPTFMFKRYQNGEFGDPKSSDAKLRLAHFMINGVGTALQNASAAIKGGQMQESDIQKYNRTNLEEGLANRWNKYKQDTQAAIDVAKQGGMSEEAITDSIATISSNNRLQSAFNQMNERQKVFALKVLGEIGNKMGNMNDTEFANTLMGMSAMGDSLDYKEAAGMLIYRFMKDPEKRDAALSEMGLLGGKNAMAGLGLGLGGGGSDGEETTTGVTLEDGTVVDPGKVMSKKELEEVQTAANNLSQKYFNGEFTEEQFRKDYAKLEDVMKQHGVRNLVSGGILSADEVINKNNVNRLNDINDKLNSLNAQAKAGTIKPADYEKQFNELKESASKWGANEKQLKAFEKSKISSEKIIKAAEKKKK